MMNKVLLLSSCHPSKVFFYDSSQTIPLQSQRPPWSPSDTSGTFSCSLCLGCSFWHLCGKSPHVLKTWLRRHLHSEPSPDHRNLPPTPSPQGLHPSTLFFKVCSLTCGNSISWEPIMQYKLPAPSPDLLIQKLWGFLRIVICACTSPPGVSDVPWGPRFIVL